MHNIKNLIIVGGGPLQIPLIKKAKEEGFHLTVLDGSEHAPGMKLADDPIVADISDHQLCVKQFKKGGNYSGVLTVGTDFTLTVASIAKHLELPGIDPKVAHAASNKGLMRELFKKSDISQPLFYRPEVGEPQTSILNALKNIDLNWPLVVKPEESMGARGVISIAKDEPYFMQAIEEAQDISRNGRCIIEEQINGDEYSIDAFVVNGEIIITGIADRFIQEPPYFIEHGHLIPSVRPEKDQQTAIEVFKEGIRAYGYDNGFAKGDIFVAQGVGYIGEIAARLSGGFMSGFTFPYATDFDLMLPALNLALGKTDVDLNYSYKRYCVELGILPPKEGVIEHISGEKTAKKLPGVKEVFLRYSPGQTIKYPKNNVEKYGNIMAVGDTPEEAKTRCQAAISALSWIFKDSL